MLQYKLLGLPRANLSISLPPKGDNDSLFLGIGLHFLSHLYLYIHPAHLHPPPSRPLLALPPQQLCSIAPSQRKARDERQIKNALFPPQPLSPCQIEFEAFHLLSHLSPSLPPLASTQNYLEPQQLDDVISLIYAEGDSRQVCPLILSTHLKSSASVI